MRKAIVLTCGAWHLEMPACFISLSASLSIATERYHLFPRVKGTKEVTQHLLSATAAVFQFEIKVFMLAKIQTQSSFGCYITYMSLSNCSTHAITMDIFD